MTGCATVVLARHGRTVWNATGRFQGHADVDLDEVGEAQAAALADRLAGTAVGSVTSSDLRRARRTAEAVAARHGLRVVTDAALREVDLGTWEGLTSAEAAERFPDEHARWGAGVDVARGGGETRADAGRRAAPAIWRAAAASAPGRVAVVVAHGYVLQASLVTLAAAGVIDPPPGGAPHLANGAWLAVDVRVEQEPDWSVSYL